MNNDLIIKKRSTRYPELSVLKYHRKVFFDNLWTEELEEARGRVVDDSGNVVALPFRKIYNYNIEQRAPKFRDDETVFWQRKVNGFMLAVSLYRDELLYSTTGSLDSDFVDMGKEMLTDAEKHALKLMLSRRDIRSVMFEIVHPNDPHIIPETPGAYLLACRRNEHELQTPFMAELEHFRQPERGYAAMSEVVQRAKLVHHEGFVVYSWDGKRSTKIKTPFYLFNKFVARASGDKILKLRKEHVDEEFYAVVDWIDANRDWFAQLDEQTRLQELRAFFTAMVK